MIRVEGLWVKVWGSLWCMCTHRAYDGDEERVSSLANEITAS